jgi:3-keto-disaccharide hydrolase
MSRSLCCLSSLLLCFTAAVPAPSQDKKPVVTDPAKAGADFAVQGEYVGEIAGNAGKVPWGVQVIARGAGKFDATAHRGGLPGTSQEKGRTINASGQTNGDVTMLSSTEGSAKIQNGVMTILDGAGNAIGELKKIERKSPTLGAKAPAGAIVLFDGTNADNFQNGRMTEDKLLMAGVTSKRTFQNCTLHLEFMTPYQPEDRDQDRGNSGCYLQGRYEVQILDSFGLEGKNNECGGIYSIRDPDVNMCLPPLSWQTYDIDYTAAKYDSEGKKLNNARITVRHNGVLVHENVELPKATTAAPVPEGPAPGPIYLQDHGNPVRFRNIWIVER